MSKPTFIKMLLFLVLVMLGIGIGAAMRRDIFTPERLPMDARDLLRQSVPVPGGHYMIGSNEQGCHPKRIVLLDSIYIWPTEVPASWWALYKGHTVPNKEMARLPAAGISYGDAVGFCDWLSSRYGIPVRLPTVEEWEVAARSGTPGVPYPWGWNNPEHQAVFDARSAHPIAECDPNPWGLYDMSGNVAEWCRADESSAAAAFVMGGSWAERDPRFLRISHALALPKSYRDQDVGFRFVIEPP
jgi:formylglycine-generating enzyme required for sulfatase activity